MVLIRSLFSFETIFVLWLFSYQYKNAFAVLTSPDITLLLTFILIPWAVYLSVKAKPKVLDKPSITFLAMSGWFILTSLWSPSHSYMMQKTLCYGLYTIPGFFMGYLVISPNEKRIERLLTSFFIFSLIIFGVCFHGFWMHGLGAIREILNTNYLVTGQTLGTGLLILLAWSLFYSKIQSQSLRGANATKQSMYLSAERLNIHGLLRCARNDCKCLFLGSLFVYGLLNGGSRGPLIAVSLTLISFYGTSFWHDKNRRSFYHLGVFLLLCCTTYFVFNWVFDHSSSHFVQRLMPVLSGQVDESLQERFTYYHSAFEAFIQHPWIGLGFGGWPIFQGLGDINLHPHNIFLEILAETGIVGFLLFLTFCFISLNHLRIPFIFSNYRYASIALLTLFSFLNALKSGDLHDNLLFFVGLSLCAGLRKHKEPIT